MQNYHHQHHHLWAYVYFAENDHFLPWLPGEVSVPLPRGREDERRDTTARRPLNSPIPRGDPDVQLTMAKLHWFSCYRLGRVESVVGQKLRSQDAVPEAVQASGQTGETGFVRPSHDVVGKANVWGERSEVHGGDTTGGCWRLSQWTLGVLWFSSLL